MTEKKKYLSAGVMLLIVSVGLIVLIISKLISGLPLVILVLLALTTSWATIAALIASVTKKPRKTFWSIFSLHTFPF
jgi:hypothetical protein